MTPWWLRPTAEAEGTDDSPAPDAPPPAAEQADEPDEPAAEAEGQAPRRRGRKASTTDAGRDRQKAAPQANKTSAAAAPAKTAPERSRSRPSRESDRNGQGANRARGRGRTAAAPPQQESRTAVRTKSEPQPARRESPRERERVGPGEQITVPLTQLEDLTREIIISVPESLHGAAAERKLALFCDLENVALGARETGTKFEINIILERLVEKGKIIVKRAYADWQRYNEYKRPFHESGIEMIDIPQRHYSGKNSADIKMVVDAMDMCYAKEHLDTFVLLSGDSDFSPLVSKLKENNKYVIGVGVKGSSSNLLIDNCDEFIYYEDIWRDLESAPQLEELPKKQREAFGLLVDSMLALSRENKDVLWGSMIKQTMLRKRPSFNEGYYGYSTFSDLLEDAEKKSVVKLKKDQRSGSYIVTGFSRKR